MLNPLRSENIMNKTHNGIKEYVFTFIIAAFVVVVLCLCIELNLLFTSEQKVNEEELNMANLSTFCTIGELEKRQSNEPLNYYIDIKLAEIYESLNKLDKAEEFYNSALKKSSRSDYSLFRYAIFCSKHSLYATSAIIAEELNMSNKYHNQYKARIYESLGDNLEKDNQPQGANKAYQVAYKYAKALNDFKYLNIIKEKYANSYIKLADYNIQNNNPQDAILNLNNSLKLSEKLLAKYKLGLIYVDIDKIQADRYISEVFNKNPYIVNPYLYNKLLNDLINDSKAANKLGSVNYYSTKLSRFKKQLLKYYIYKDDILIENVYIKNNKKWFNNNDNYVLLFDLKNNTKYTLNSLYVKIELIINSKEYIVEKKIISKTLNLNFYDVLSDVHIKLPSEININNPKIKNTVFIKFYAKKIKNGPWTLIKIEQLNI